MDLKKVAPKESINALSRGLRYIRNVGYFYYYRYSVEIGISVLEGWEACIVNSIFLLLIASVIKYGWSTMVYLYGLLATWILRIV